MKDLLVVSRFKNSILFDLIGERTLISMATEIGVPYHSFMGLLNLQRSPVCATGEYTPTAEKIAAHFKMLPEDLFPESLYRLVLPRKVERRYDSKVVMMSLAQAEEQKLLPPTDTLDAETDQTLLREKLITVLRTLTPSQQKVIEMRYGLDGDRECTLSETGETLNVSTERIRQIEATAMRHLRHPSRAKHVRDFLEGVRS